MRLTLLMSLVCGTVLSACIPDVYLIDRQTVLELEASGDWVELDQQFQNQSLNAGPLPLESTQSRIEQRQIFSMTHSDFESKTKAAK